MMFLFSLWVSVNSQNLNHLCTLWLILFSVNIIWSCSSFYYCLVQFLEISSQSLTEQNEMMAFGWKKRSICGESAKILTESCRPTETEAWQALPRNYFAGTGVAYSRRAGLSWTPLHQPYHSFCSVNDWVQMGKLRLREGRGNEGSLAIIQW